MSFGKDKMHLYDAKFERERSRFLKCLNDYHSVYKKALKGNDNEVNHLKNIIQSYEER